MRKKKIMARPLTKRDSAGNLYVRPERVEAQINKILSRDLAMLKHRLSITDAQLPNYLLSECLVYLIRDSRRNKDDAILNAVFPILFTRCEKILLAKVQDNELSNAAYVREEVLGQFGELFATDGTEENCDNLDYFECHFNKAFRSFYIDLIRSERTRLRRFVPLPDQADTPQSNSHEGIPSQVIEAVQSPDTVEHAVLQRELREAIDTLTDDERRAVNLYYVEGYKIESKNPNEVTVATICNVSGRTIRYRLARAIAKLSFLLNKEALP
ncbi:MAG: hypothetical protein F4Y79_02725 [Gemmatimonadetes bacterium]|nr:hypothetical protein [Gemmatimonadota bacterium]